MKRLLAGGKGRRLSGLSLMPLSAAALGLCGPLDARASGTSHVHRNAPAEGDAPKEETPKAESPPEPAPKEKAPNEAAPTEPTPKEEAPNAENPSEPAPKGKAPNEAAPAEIAPTEGDTPVEGDAPAADDSAPIEAAPEPEPEASEADDAAFEEPEVEDVDFGEDDDDFGGFEIVDLEDDPEALAEELKVETPKVKGDSGTVTGMILDASTGEPLIGAYIELPGTRYATKTDLEGNFKLDLPVGTHTLRIRYDTHQPLEISQVEVRKGEEQSFRRSLTPLAETQVVEVTAERKKGSEGARLKERQESVESRDILSSEEISKSGGGSTAGVAKRIVGATVIDGRFLFVRGLGHRYGNTLLDGARVPSPEPELRTVPLDIFPSGALSAINIQKTFMPDMPGDFAGASTQLETRDIPEEFVFQAKASIGADTVTTGKEVLRGDSHRLDGIGFGNISRDLPEDFPTDHPASAGELDENYQPIWTNDQIENYGEALTTNTAILHGKKGPPNWGAGLVAGHGFGFGSKGGKFGTVLALDYGRGIRNYREDVRLFGASCPTDLVDGECPEALQLQVDVPQVDLKGWRTVDQVKWSSLGMVKLNATKHHKFELMGFYSRDADHEARELEGHSAVNNEPILETRLRYTARGIAIGRFGGQHEFHLPRKQRLELDYFGALGHADRSDPAIRTMLFVRPDSADDYVLDVSSGQASTVYLDLKDKTYNGAMNLGYVFKQWAGIDTRIKLGGWAESKQRRFVARRFNYNIVSGFTPPGGQGNIINPDTIGAGVSMNAGGTEPFFLKEGTNPRDSYRATQDVYAGYAMVELPLTWWLRLAGGARYERHEMRVNPFNIFTAVEDEEESYDSRITDNDTLPAGAIIFSPRREKMDMNIRLSAAKTVARPEFRELAPFAFTDFVGGVSTQGNTGIVSTDVWNADARWEWFPSAAEVVAFSIFYKYFDNPIEPIVKSGSGGQSGTFANADSAQNIGGELELRKNLEFLAPKNEDLGYVQAYRRQRARQILRSFSIGLNATYVNSRVKLPERADCDPSELSGAAAEACSTAIALDQSTSRNRALVGQAPYVINAYLDYELEKYGTGLRALYNVVGRKIYRVGGNGLPDYYEEPFHAVDFVYTQRLYEFSKPSEDDLEGRNKGILELSFKVGNILNSRRRWTQDHEALRSFRPGTTFDLGLAYKY